MKKGLGLFACVLLLSGCSGGLYSQPLAVEVNLASPMFGLNDALPVVYPSRAGGVSGDPMADDFGPSWRSLEADYPAYRFNP